MSTQRFTPEFKEEAVRQVIERGYPVSEVASRVGVSTHSLYKWVRGEDTIRALKHAKPLRRSHVYEPEAADRGEASLPRYRLAVRFASSGAKLMSKRDPVASANRSSVRIDGRERPLSRRATTGCVVPILRASSSCVRPARLRTSMTAPARTNSSSSAS